MNEARWIAGATERDREWEKRVQSKQAHTVCYTLHTPNPCASHSKKKVPSSSVLSHSLTYMSMRRTRCLLLVAACYLHACNARLIFASFGLACHAIPYAHCKIYRFGCGKVKVFSSFHCVPLLLFNKYNQKSVYAILPFAHHEFSAINEFQEHFCFLAYCSL